MVIVDRAEIVGMKMSFLSVISNTRINFKVDRNSIKLARNWLRDSGSPNAQKFLICLMKSNQKSCEFVFI